MAKRLLTEADMHRLPGLILGKDEHSFLSPQGRVTIVGALPMDEQFGSELFGLLNIRKAHEIVAQTDLQPQVLPLNDGLKKNIAKIEYDHQVIKKMTPERRDQPVYMLLWCDGVNVIDGAHRLKRRFRDKLPDVRAYIFRPETLGYLRVTMFREGDGGQRIQIGGLTDEQLQHQIDLAKETEALMRGKSRGFGALHAGGQHE